jgi:hypothetical protein
MMNLRSRGEVIDNAQLVGRLCMDSVELCAAHARHVATHGNLIPHAFMGDVLARAGACAVAVGANSAHRGVELAAILATLESALAGGHRETCSVIGISFISDGEGEPFFAALRPLLGPRLGALVRT